jgi:response regulator RpfG family c-di-GMP phosphodiesterase
MTQGSGDKVLFAEEKQAVEPVVDPDAYWKVIIVDDDRDVHEITKLALKDFRYVGEPLLFISAYSGEEARQLLAEHDDIAIVLLDVVMETDNAGLQLVKYIRDELGNPFIRIILRTGQPGQAPERQVVQDYDINDYKEKTELTSKKLYTSIFTALGNYRALTGLDANRRGLVKVIEASASIYEEKNLDQFIQGVLEQVVALLFIDREAILVRNYAITSDGGDRQVIIAAIGKDREFIGMDPRDVLPEDVNGHIQHALQTHHEEMDEYTFTGYIQARTGAEAVIFISSATKLQPPDRELLELFFRNITVGLENLYLWNDIEETQSEIVYLLGDAVETRSNETGNHVRRVSEISRQLALLNDMDPAEADILHMAAPLHDIGKIGIPDAILNKPDKLDADEWEIMRTHADQGARILSGSNKPTLKAAAIVAGQHHENWDGSGYPAGLSGEDIHIYGRLVAIADVYDALCSKRSYKTSWLCQDAAAFMREQRGIKFDPRLIDLFIENIALFEAIRARYPDQ